uniref:hypothetical protein n=1 Tax=Candidatus Cryptobacteroides bacterium TaxID=3085639 RepID=UPI004025223D
EIQPNFLYCQKVLADSNNILSSENSGDMPEITSGYLVHPVKDVFSIGFSINTFYKESRCGSLKPITAEHLVR